MSRFPCASFCCFSLLALLLTNADVLVAQSNCDDLVILDGMIASDSELQVRDLDKISLTKKREFMGEVERETVDTVRFVVKKNMDDPGFPYTFDMDEVIKIERRNLPEQVYKRLRQKMGFDGDDVQHRSELSCWCFRVGMNTEGREHLFAALKLAPDYRELYEVVFEQMDQKDDFEKSETELDEELGVCLRGLKLGIHGLELSERAASKLEALQDVHAAIRMLEPFESASEDDLVDSPDVVARGEQRLARLLEKTGQRKRARTLVSTILARGDGESALNLLELEATWLLEDVAAGIFEARQSFLDTIDKMVALDADHARSYVLRGTYHALTEDFKAANKDYAKALQRGAIGAAEMLSSALNYARAGEKKKTDDLLPGVRHATDPLMQIQYRLVKAYHLENQGLGDEAKGLLEEVRALGDVPWQAWVILLQNRMHESGLLENDQVERLLTAHVDNPSAFGEIALLKAQQALTESNGADARRWLEYSVSSRPDDPEVLLRYGVAHLQDGGDLKKAREALTRAYELEADNLDTLNAMGCLEYREGNLPLASGHFQAVIRTFSDEEQESADPPVILAYAQRGLRQTNDALTEEEWFDDFARPDNRVVLNNWNELERFGIDVDLMSSQVVFQGTQTNQDQGLTMLTRETESDRLNRVRASVVLPNGFGKARVALRIEGVEGDNPDGLVIFRDLDGVLGFATNRGDESAAFLPPDPAEGEDDEEDQKDEHSMKRVEWPDDNREHTIEVRFVDDEIRLYFDGVEFARNVDLPVRGTSLSVGVSGQAPLGTPYRFIVKRFEIRRTRPQTSSSSGF